MKVLSALAAISFMTISGAASAGIDCSSVVPGAKNLGDIQQFLKDNGYNNLNQLVKASNEANGTDIKTGEFTQIVLAACGVGSEAP